MSEPVVGERILFFDLEVSSSRSLTDRSIPLVEYARHATVDMVAWTETTAFEGSFTAQASRDLDAFTEAFARADRVVAHNIEYDLTVLRESPGTREAFQPLVDGRVTRSDGGCVPTCSMAMAELLNMPGSLGELVKKLGCGEKVDYDFAEAQWEAGVLWETPERARAREALLLERARGDVEIMVKAFRILRPRIKPAFEWSIMAESTRIGMRGVAVDEERLARELPRLVKRSEEVAKDFKDKFGFSPSQDRVLLEWLRQWYPDLQSVKKDSLMKLLEVTDRVDVTEAIELRQQVASDKAKLERMQQHTVDGRVRNQYRFAGASTGRWTSHSVQIHNLSRGGEARQIMRGGEGKKLFISDFAQIELRVALWLAGHQDRLDYLAEGNDLYMDTARRVFGPQAGKDKRQLAKVALIASMYGTGARTIQRLLKLPSEQEAVELREGIHREFPGFMRTQRVLGDMMVQAIGGNCTPFGDKVAFGKSGSAVAIILPTGRRIWYHSAYLPPRMDQDDDWRNRFLFAYRKSDEVKRSKHGKRPADNKVHNGWTVFENICQGYAREFLARAIVNLARSGVAVPIAHVHDEAICEVDLADVNDATLARLHGLMTDFGDDCPPGLHLAAESVWLDSLAKSG